MKRRTLLHDILGPGGLSILFQPIFEIAGGETVLFALEALARGPKDSNVEPANVLFEYVRRKGKEVEVDRACLARAIASGAAVPGSRAALVCRRSCRRPQLRAAAMRPDRCSSPSDFSVCKWADEVREMRYRTQRRFRGVVFAVTTIQKTAVL